MVTLKNKYIGLDTNIFIYFFGGNKKFGLQVRSIFENLSDKKSRATTSVITLTELLSLPAADKEIEEIKMRFLATPNLVICDVNQTISVDAARIRRQYGFRVPDSIQLATCIYEKADVFVTNDEKLKTFKEITIILLDK